MGSNGLRERLLVVLLVAFMVSGGAPLALATGGGALGGMAPVAGGPAGGHQWPMFGADASHAGLAGDFERGLSNPGVKWQRSLIPDSHATVLGNFTGNVMATNSSHRWDGQLHCAVFTTPSQVRLVEGTEGEDVWVANLTGTFSAAPALGDVDSDGRTDVLLASRTGVLYAYEPVVRWNGTEFSWWSNNTQREQLWNTTGASVGTITASNLVLEDLSANGTPELVLGTSNGVYCMNARYGNELWNRTVSGSSASTPAVYSVGTQLNVVATSFNATPAPDEVSVYTLRGTTGALLKRVTMEASVALNTFLPPLPFLPSPVAADIDGDDDGDELVIIQPYEGTTGRVIVFEDGDLAWGSVAYNKSLGGASDLNHICHATPAVGDLDGDGVLEVAVTSWRTYQLPLGTNTYTNVSVFEGIKGTRRWARDIDLTSGIDLEWSIASPVLLDADKDGLPDVALLQYNGRMSALSGKNGTRLWDITTRGYPTALVTTSPAVGDLDLDGFPEIVANGLAVSYLLPDLQVEGEDITLTDPTPEEGDRVGIDVLVHNRGNEDATDVLVSVWDGQELAGNATIDTIVAGSSYSARVQHEFYGRVSHTLTVQVDPLGEVEELREDNNEASLEVTIVSKYGVSLECDENETVISPGTTWHFFCEARNLGIYGNRVRVETAGDPADWTVSVDAPVFTLAASGSPGDRRTVDVSVRAEATAAAGEYPIVLTATSVNESRNNDSVVLTTVVKGRHGVYLTPTEVRRSVAPGDAAVYKFNATNIGNEVDSFDVEAIPAAARPDWGINVFPKRIDALDPEGVREISLSVSAPFEATEGDALTVFLNVVSVGDPSRYDESRTVTSVVIPDLSVVEVRYERADGSVVDGSDARLVADEASRLVARLTNLRRNTDISTVRVRFTVDGGYWDGTLTDLTADGYGEVVHEHTFTATGRHDVQVVADPFEVISDADRSNNAWSGSVQVKGRDPVGPFDVSGTVYMPDGVTPVSGAEVRIAPSLGSPFTVTADDQGAYCASVAANRYKDGDALVVNATDGRDYAEETLAAYSEDGGATVDLVLREGIHYDTMLVVASEEVDVESGQEVTVNVTLLSIGTRGTMVDLSVMAAGWGPRLSFDNGTLASTIFVEPDQMVGLVLAFTVPPSTLGGQNMTFTVVATSRDDPEAVARLNVTATVQVRRGFTMTVTGIPTEEGHPGQDRLYNITFQSLANVADMVDLYYDPSFSEWNLSFTPSQVQLPPLASAVVRVTFTIPSWAEARDNTISVSGVSVGDDSVVNNTYIEETVVALGYGVSVSTLQPVFTGKPGETAIWSMTLTNLGNVRDAYDLEVFGLPAGYVYRFEDEGVAISRVTVSAGGSENVLLEVDIPTSFSGTPQSQVSVTVKATSTAPLSSVFNNTVLTLQLDGLLDLTVEVAPDTSSPEKGRRVTFAVTVKNSGPDVARGVVVFAYWGDEKVKKTVGTVEALSSKEVTLDWIPRSEGRVNVRIVVNPADEEGSIFETDTTNNEWSQAFRVEEAASDSILTEPLLWVVLVIILVVLAGLYVYSGRGGGPDAAVDVAKVVDVVEDEEGDEGEDEPSEGKAPPPKRKPKAAPAAPAAARSKPGKAPPRKAPPKKAPPKKAPPNKAPPRSGGAGATKRKPKPPRPKADRGEEDEETELLKLGGRM